MNTITRFLLLPAVLSVPLFCHCSGQHTAIEANRPPQGTTDPAAPQAGRQYAAGDTIEATSLTTIILPVSNSDPAFIGYTGDEFGEEGRGPSAIEIHGGSLYILDGFHNNIKRADIASEARVASRPFIADGEPPPQDMQATDDGLWVINNSGTLYRVSFDLQSVTSVPLPPGLDHKAQNFLRSPDGIVRLYCASCGLVASFAGEHPTLDTVDHSVTTRNRLLAERFVIRGDGGTQLAQLHDGRLLRLSTSLPRLEPFWAFNTAADEHRFVFFGINSKKMTIQVYSF